MIKITVVTADIIDSRKNEDSLYSVRQQLSKIYDASIVSPFSISRGDEIQGMMTGWLSQPQLIRHLRYFCRPLQLKIGIGIGNIEEKNIKENPWDMDGHVFHLARKALNELNRQKKSRSLLKTDHPEFDRWINTIWLFIDTLQQKWTQAQWEGIYAYENAGTYRQAAEMLDIAYQNVEKRCKAANWLQLKYAEETLANTEKLYSLFTSRGVNSIISSSTR